MNLAIFLLHSFVVLTTLLLALRRGKEYLMLFVAASWLFANFFVTKQIMLFGFEVTASDVYAIGALLGTATLQEYFGRKVARETIWISFSLLVFAAISVFFHLSYIPSPHDTMHPLFVQFLTPTPRLACASFATFLIVQYIELALFAFLQRFQVIPFFIRACLTISCIQCVDTLLFSFVGLYGLVHSLFDIVIVSLVVKLIIVLLSAPFLVLCNYLIPRTKYDTVPL